MKQQLNILFNNLYSLYKYYIVASVNILTGVACHLLGPHNTITFEELNS